MMLSTHTLNKLVREGFMDSLKNYITGAPPAQPTKPVPNDEVVKQIRTIVKILDGAVEESYADDEKQRRLNKAVLKDILGELVRTYRLETKASEERSDRAHRAAKKQGAPPPEEPALRIRLSRSASPSLTSLISRLKTQSEKNNLEVYSVLQPALIKAGNSIGFVLDTIAEEPSEVSPKEKDTSEGETSVVTTDTKAVLNMLDPIADEWTKVSKATKDKKLKKAMAYIEKIGLSEAQEFDRWKVLSGIK